MLFPLKCPLGLPREERHLHRQGHGRGGSPTRRWSSPGHGSLEEFSLVRVYSLLVPDLLRQRQGEITLACRGPGEGLEQERPITREGRGDRLDLRRRPVHERGGDMDLLARHGHGLAEGQVRGPRALRTWRGFRRDDRRARRWLRFDGL